MNCPSCNIPLVMSERQGIEIDYCPQCRGIWLDRGELDKIIEKSAALEAISGVNPSQQQPSTPTQQQFQNPYEQQRQYEYHKRKQKSWLNDLFD